jgi:hypothetical protein
MSLDDIHDSANALVRDIIAIAVTLKHLPPACADDPFMQPFEYYNEGSA